MSQTKRAIDKFLLYALLIIGLGVVGFISATTVIDPNYMNTTGSVLGSSGIFTGAVSGTSGSFSGALTGTTLDTGQGANDLFDMDQNVLQASAVTFSTINTGQGANELFDMNQNVETTSAVTFSSINTGQGANELFDMDQNVLQTSDVTFNDVTVTDTLTLGAVARTTWPSGLNTISPYTFIIEIRSGITYAYWADNQTLFRQDAIDSVPIQAALDTIEAMETGGWIFVKAGIYNIEETIVLYSNTGIIGEGGELLQDEGTIFKGASNLDDNVMEFDTTPSDTYNLRITLKDFAIDGNDAVNTNPVSTYDCNGIHAYKAIKCVFENLEIRYVNDIGIWLNGTAFGGGTIHSYDNTLSNCYLTNCYRGIMTSYSEENQIIGCYTGSNDQNGIYLASNLNLVNGGVSVYDGDGIRVSGIQNTIIGWYCDRPDQSCIEMDNFGSLTDVQIKIVNCHFHNPSESANHTYAAIQIGANTQYGLIEGNALSYYAANKAVANYVVDWGATCDYWIVKNNDFRYFDDAMFELGGGCVNNIASDNWG